MKDEIYPGHGACETCGEIDPCKPCSGVWIQADTSESIKSESFWWKEASSEKDTTVNNKKINLKLASTNKL